MKRTRGEGKKKVHKSIISLLFKTEKTLTDMKFFFYNCIFTVYNCIVFLESNKKENPEKVFSSAEPGKIGFCTCLERKSVLQVNHGLFDLHQQKL